MKRSWLVSEAILALAITGCADQETLVPPTPDAPAASYGGTLELEIRGSAEVSLTGTSPQETQVSVKITGAEAPHLLDDGTTLEGPGRFEPLPESESELYVAKLALPADPQGPCGAEPRAVALSLHHRKPGTRFAGALTIYCGTRHYGVPARVVRLTGTLEPR
jgi:hypothetical protein